MNSSKLAIFLDHVWTSAQTVIQTCGGKCCSSVVSESVFPSEDQRVGGLSSVRCMRCVVSLDEKLESTVSLDPGV